MNWCPGLGTILVGDDPGSLSYVSGKHRDCKEVGITSVRVDLPASASQSDVLAAIKDLNSAAECTGYIVQLPLPKAINTQIILEAIDPAKDADGLHPMNLGRLVAGYDAPLPCTPRGIVALLNHYKINLNGAEVVVIGRGLTVGRPLGLLLTRKQENATVTLTHTGTKDLGLHTRNADIVVAAIGQAHFLNASMIKAGAAVIDVGISMLSKPSIRITSSTKSMAAAKSGRQVGVRTDQGAFEVSTEQPSETKIFSTLGAS